VAKKKSDKYPYQWADGTYHSITEEQHVQNRGTPIAPPPGSYDPSIDMQGRQADQGLRNLEDNSSVADERALEDYTFGNTAYDVQGTRGKEDYATAKDLAERNYGRAGTDLQTAATQGEQDYGTNLSNLVRQYTQLGTAQGEAQRKAGAMAGSGASIQAARKRAENQTLDKAPIDTAYNRFKESNTLAQGRLGEDKKSDLDSLALQLKRQGEDIEVGKGGLLTTYGRSTKDTARGLQQARDENTGFQQDIAKIRQFQSDTPVIFRPGSSTPGAGASPVASTNPPAAANALTAGPNAPRQPGATRTVTTTKKKGKKTRTYGTAVTTA
jgi:hypothetical protein